MVEEKAEVETIETALRAIGCLVEARFRGSGALAVDCETNEIFERARSFLARQDRLGFEIMHSPYGMVEG